MQVSAALHKSVWDKEVDILILPGLSTYGPCYLSPTSLPAGFFIDTHSRGNFIARFAALYCENGRG